MPSEEPRYGPATPLMELSAAICHFASGPKNRNAEKIEELRKQIAADVELASAATDHPDWHDRVNRLHDACLSILSVLESHAGFEIVLREMESLIKAQQSLGNAAVSFAP